MDKTLGYLRETLSNYSEDNSLGQHLLHKLLNHKYASEGDFVRHLTAKEIDFLNGILKKEIQYAKDEQDEKRTYELNEVFELLF
ncbi:sigma-G-dependent sporulation-specific acid-soluble spore protein CsgA [Neobacillus terrae]|uniref:sigma-G-dependent sporulation-specific acid-soluble spore protein CsgA n=1 Tax=Neobacillus terrae TaxID=3034837 RepID=UPI00140D26FE|nr:sigma-G-dependent sporulation-specific acid-soluble spore protein CsgA [Neobacillus terrae]NHM29447.1 sporulation protein [Neobacillus terrae]